MTKAKRKPKQNGIVIERNVALPKARMSYPFADMKVGDSFFVSGVDTNRLAAAGHGYSLTHPGTKFIVRKEKDGARIWRIA